MIIKEIINNVCSYWSFAQLSQDQLNSKIKQAIFKYAHDQHLKFKEYHILINKLLDQFDKLKK